MTSNYIIRLCAPVVASSNRLIEPNTPTHHGHRIAQDLRMSPGDCATLFRETGASTKRVYGANAGVGAAQEEGEEEGGGGKGKGKGKGGEEVVVELALPLKFPEVKRVIRAKK